MTDDEPIPDAWPPEPAGPAHSSEESSTAALVQQVPMFPLPGIFLHPRQVMPLNIFEPRYKRMIEDSLDGPGRLVIGTILEGSTDRIYDTANPPAVLPVAGIGEIARHERTSDGRFHIWLVGLARVAIEELHSDTPYRRVRATPLLEIEPEADAAARLRSPLERAILSRNGRLLNLPDDMPTSMLVDLLSPHIQAPQAELERIYSEPDLVLRARLALRAHAAFPPAPDDSSSDE